MNIELKPLSDQVMLITGASSGIGLVTSRIAARRGAKVMLVARDEAALRRAADEIGAAGGSAAWAVADVGDAAQLARAADQAVALWGRIDTWVNDAGVGIVARLVDTPLAEHHRIFRTNYFGVVNGATIEVDHLRERGGALITVASIAADVPAPMLGAYAATKHGCGPSSRRCAWNCGRMRRRYRSRWSSLLASTRRSPCIRPTMRAARP